MRRCTEYRIVYFSPKTVSEPLDRWGNSQSGHGSANRSRVSRPPWKPLKSGTILTEGKTGDILRVREDYNFASFVIETKQILLNVYNIPIFTCRRTLTPKTNFACPIRNFCITPTRRLRLLYSIILLMFHYYNNTTAAILGEKAHAFIV